MYFDELFCCNYDILGIPISTTWSVIEPAHCYERKFLGLTFSFLLDRVRISI